MRTITNPTISVIIPAYNEEARIAPCLRALQQQTVLPFEIIVVDNNSTDQTAAIVSRFPNIRLVHEQKQGLSHARNRGFAEARGDILARIDADAVVNNDWIEQVQTWFSQHPDGAAVTGYGRSTVGLTSERIGRIWSWAYQKHVQGFFGIPILWGSNMAMSAQAWRRAQKYCILDDRLVHEDQDLSLALASVGVRVDVNPAMFVNVDFGDVQYMDKFLSYYQRKHSTRRLSEQSDRPQVATVHPLKRMIFQVITLPILGSHFAICVWSSSTRRFKATYNVARNSIVPDAIE